MVGYNTNEVILIKTKKEEMAKKTGLVTAQFTTQFRDYAKRCFSWSRTSLCTFIKICFQRRGGSARGKAQISLGISDGRLTFSVRFGVEQPVGWKYTFWKGLPTAFQPAICAVEHISPLTNLRSDSFRKNIDYGPQHSFLGGWWVMWTSNDELVTLSLARSGNIFTHMGLWQADLVPTSIIGNKKQPHRATISP